MSIAHAAGNDSNSWSDRGDRWEGIRPQNVTSTAFELLGLQVIASLPAHSSPTSSVSIIFPSLEKLTLNVQVWEPDANYVMKPKQVDYSLAQPFSWPLATVLNNRQISVDRLQLLARDAKGHLVPGILSSIRIAQQPHMLGYRFSLASESGFDLHGGIYREDAGRLVKVRDLSLTQNYGGVYDFEWTWGESERCSLTAGIYHLKLTGIILLPNGQDPEDFDASFLHYKVCDG